MVETLGTLEYKLEGFLGEDVPWIETISAGDGQEFPVGLP